MTQEFIIADNTIKYANGNNPINERMLYGGEPGHWSRKIELAKKYPTAETAVVDAKILYAELPVKIFVIQQVQNGVNLGEVPFQI